MAQFNSVMFKSKVPLLPKFGGLRCPYGTIGTDRANQELFIWTRDGAFSLVDGKRLDSAILVELIECLPTNSEIIIKANIPGGTNK